MRTTEQDLVARARYALEGILVEVPKLKLEWGPQALDLPPEVAGLVDFTFRVTTDNHRSHVVVGEVKAHGFPQQLTKAIDQLLRYRNRAHQQGNELIVAAPYITPEGAKVCRDDNVSWFDLAGNCRIAFGTVYIERTGRPNPFQKNAMAAPSLYGMRGERILRILLNGPQKPWKVAPLVKHAGVSAGTVSTIRKLLVERDWAKVTSEGILLTQPARLLRDWAQVWGRRAFRPAGYFSRVGLDETEKRLGEFAHQKGRKLALTGAAAAWRYAPMTRYQRTQVYFDGEPDELARALDLKKTDTGANVHILTPRDRGAFDGQETSDGIPIVSPVQAYLDLQRDPARGAEAADHLWQTRLFHG